MEKITLSIYIKKKESFGMKKKLLKSLIYLIHISKPESLNIVEIKVVGIINLTQLQRIGKSNMVGL